MIHMGKGSWRGSTCSKKRLKSVHVLLRPAGAPSSHFPLSLLSKSLGVPGSELNVSACCKFT